MFLSYLLYLNRKCALDLTHHIYKKKPSNHFQNRLLVLFCSSENFVKLLERFFPLLRFTVTSSCSLMLGLPYTDQMHWLEVLCLFSIYVTICFIPKAGAHFVVIFSEIYHGGFEKIIQLPCHVAWLKYFTVQGYFKIHLTN